MASFVDDDDDISLCSTTWTEYQSDYDDSREYFIDRILAERIEKKDQSLSYLLKWQGYGVERACYEIEDNVPDLTIQAWSERKDRVNAKLEAPFDVEQWENDVQRIIDEKAVRKERRRVKRERLGILTKYRRGKSQDAPLLHDPEESPHDDGHDAMDVDAEVPLFEPEGNRDKNRPRARLSDLPVLDTQSLPEPLVAPAPQTAPPQPSLPKTTNAGNRSVVSANTGRPRHPSPVKPAVRPVSARKPVNIFADNWKAQKMRTRRASSSTTKTRDIGNNDEVRKAPKPMTLSHLHKINKASLSDRAPTISLDEIQELNTSQNPLTRKPSNPTVPAMAGSSPTVAPDTSNSTGNAPAASMSAASTHTNAPVEPRSTSPTSSYRRPSTTTNSSAAPSASLTPVGPRHPEWPTPVFKFRICKHWLNGKCPWTAEDCRFLHSDIPYKDRTCYFWLGRHCVKTETECQFAHRMMETYLVPQGRDAIPPRTASGSTYRPAPVTDPRVTRPMLERAPLDAERITPDERGSPVELGADQRVLAHAERPAILKQRPLERRVTCDERAADEGPLTTGQSAAAQGLVISLVIPGAKEEISVQLQPEHPSIAILLEATRGKNPHLEVSLTITDKIYELFLASEPNKSVNVSSGQVQRNGSALTWLACWDALAARAKSMGAAAAAFAVVYQEWAMILYFESDARFFGDSRVQHNGENQLQFQILSAQDSSFSVSMLDDRGQVTREQFVSYIYRHFAGVQTSDFEKVFEWFGGKVLDRRVFLWFEGHRHERDLLTAMLRPLVPSITTNDQPDAWSKFVGRITNKENGARATGVVLFHPANRNFDAIPDLRRLAFSSVNFYMFGPCTNNHVEPFSIFEPVQLWKMWATGTVTMISEGLLRQHPRRTQKVVDFIAHRMSRTPFSERTWKLFTRPRVIDWLRDTAIEARNVDAAGAWREWAQLADTINDNLCPEDYFIYGTNDPTPEATLISPSTEYYEEQMRRYRVSGEDDKEAEISYFADWSKEKVFEFRRFCVVVPEMTPEYVKMQERWQHIRIVTPEKYVETFTQ